MPLLEVSDINVRFGGVVALGGLSFTIDEGQICALIGPNGAGKTTLFNVVSRLYEPNEGSVRFAGIGIATLIRYVGAGAGSLVVALIVMTVFFLVDVWLVKVQVQDTAMAFAPGAMDVMMAIALTMHLDPVFVGAHHLFRFLGVSVTMPFVIRAVAPKASELPESEI